MIFTDKAAKEKISALESRISELEADLAIKDGAIETLQADVTARDQTIAEHVATIGTRDEAISAAETLATANAAEIITLKAAVTTAENSAAQSAVEIAAAAGIEKPLNIEGGGATGEKQTMTRAEFSSLSAFAKMEFTKNGGKITD